MLQGGRQAGNEPSGIPLDYRALGTEGCGKTLKVGRRMTVDGAHLAGYLRTSRQIAVCIEQNNKHQIRRRRAGRTDGLRESRSHSVGASSSMIWVSIVEGDGSSLGCLFLRFFRLRVGMKVALPPPGGVCAGVVAAAVDDVSGASMAPNPTSISLGWVTHRERCIQKVRGVDEDIAVSC